jgi:hypothetical protein
MRLSGKLQAKVLRNTVAVSRAVESSVLPRESCSRVEVRLM